MKYLTKQQIALMQQAINRSGQIWPVPTAQGDWRQCFTEVNGTMILWYHNSIRSCQIVTDGGVL